MKIINGKDIKFLTEDERNSILMNILGYKKMENCEHDYWIKPDETHELVPLDYFYSPTGMMQILEALQSKGTFVRLALHKFNYQSICEITPTGKIDGRPTYGRFLDRIYKTGDSLPEAVVNAALEYAARINV